MKLEENLRPGVESVFSILPRDQAKEAERELLAHYRDASPAGPSLQIHWAEFSVDKRILRAGCTDLDGLHTQVYVDDNSDVEIQRMITKINRYDFKVGSVEKIPGEERFLWFVPTAQKKLEAKPDARIKGISVNKEVFDHVLDIFNPKARLTKAEKRVIFQLTAGQSLNESASADQVSIETKRAQLKHACGKLSCNSQMDIVRLALGQIVHLISVTSTETEDTEIVERFAKRYFSNHVNFSVKRLPNGRLIRLLETGPADGKPVILLHGMLYPLILCNALSFLREEGIRLIMPIRQGFLESRPIYELYKKDTLLEKSLEDIALYVENSFSKPVALMGQSLGSVIAIRMVNRSPKLFSHLICASVNQAQGHPSASDYNQRFYSGLRQLLNKPGIFRLVSWQFRKYYTDEKTARTILRKMFEACEFDRDVLDAELGGHAPYSWFRDSFHDSILGIAEDFSFAMDSSNYRIQDIKIPVTFIQGSDDPMTTQSALEALSNLNPQSTTLVIEEGGHLTYASHPKEFWPLVSRALASEDRLVAI